MQLDVRKMWISSMLLLKLSRDFINLNLISAKAPSKWYFKFLEPQDTQNKMNKHSKLISLVLHHDLSQILDTIINISSSGSFLMCL